MLTHLHGENARLIFKGRANFFQLAFKLLNFLLVLTISALESPIVLLSVWNFSWFSFFMLRCYLQKRVLNASRGPAVRALRAQTDKREYAMEMRKIVERQVLLNLAATLLSFLVVIKLGHLIMIYTVVYCTTASWSGSCGCGANSISWLLELEYLFWDYRALKCNNFFFL